MPKLSRDEVMLIIRLSRVKVAPVTDSLIAKETGVSPGTVGKHRRENDDLSAADLRRGNSDAWKAACGRAGLKPKTVKPGEKVYSTRKHKKQRVEVLRADKRSRRE